MLKNLLLLLFGIISFLALLDWLDIVSFGDCDACSRIECDDSKRYDTILHPGGGTAVTEGYADTLANNFELKYLDSVHVSECYFSKKAIDHIFAHHPTANTLGCTFVLENDSLKVIINTYRIDRTEIDIPPALDSTNVISKTLCPPTCPAPK